MTDGEKVFFTHYVEYIDHRLHRFFVKILVAFAVLGLTLAVGYFYVDKVSDQNTKGLCTIRENAQDQITRTEDFLKEHPEGFAGLSPAVLRRGLESQKRTVEALKDVDCV